MSKEKHNEAQIIAARKQVEAGRKVEDLARECGVSKHTIYAWKSKYGVTFRQRCVVEVEAGRRRVISGSYLPA